MDQVEEVKSKIDIVTLVGEYVTLTRAGRNFKGICPFHQERTPSFIVSPELAIWKCFGCGLGGDVISFVEQIEGMEFYEALKYLADRVGVKLVRPDNPRFNYKEKLVEINRLASDFYRYVLVNHSLGKVALKYLLETRGLEMATIKEFGLGFAPNAPQALYRFLTKKKLAPTDLEKAGVVISVRGSFVDRFRGRIIFPLCDHRGEVVGLAGRILPGEDNGKLAKYINSPETEIYHKSKILYGLNLTKKAIKKKQRVVVVEGELDAISSWQAGVDNVVAIKGSALTEDQVKLVVRLADQAILALDSDIAGNMAARRGIEVAEGLGLGLKVANLGKYKDPDEAARSDSSFYKSALEKALDVWDFLINSTFAKHPNLEGREKALISKEVVPVLAGISDEIVRAHYTKLVAEKLDVPVNAVLAEMEKSVVKKDVQKESGDENREPVQDRESLLEKEIFSLGLRLSPKSLLKKDTYELFKTPLWGKIVHYLKDYLGQAKKFDLAVFAKSLPKELLDGLVLSTMVDDYSDEDKVAKEMAVAIKALKLLRIKKLEIETEKRLTSLEKTGDKSMLRKVNEEFKKLSVERALLEEE